MTRHKLAYATLLALTAVLPLIACQSEPASDAASTTAADATDARTDDPSNSSYYDLGDYRRDVTTTEPEAAIWFVRGLIQGFGFNHEEAVRCYERALELDPEMAMAHWGIAYALGPNYNNVEMEPEVAKRAFDSAQRAQELATTASPVEQALITAISSRYAWPISEDRAALELAYANAMRTAHQAHPDDPDVAAFLAEALMMLSPWALWSADGEPAAVTPELRAVLEPALVRWPDHSLLCHLYIHTMEPSPEHALALPAANSLRSRTPDASHLVHMPSHIDVLVGDYARMIAANKAAIEADKKFVAKQGRLNFFTLYRLHDYHFLVYGAMFDGQKQLAIDTARELVTEIPAELLADIPDFIEAFVSTPFHVLVRYGMWNEILAEPEPPAAQPYTRAIWHYARSIALATLGRVDEAEVELARLIEWTGKVPESRILFNNSCADLLQIATAMAQGELEYRKGNFDKAFEHLRNGVELDDHLNYDEPWGWMQPVRHALGALLLEQGKLAEAEQVLREDLRRHPNNGWALQGLAEALERRGAVAEATACKAELDTAWTRADIPATTPCFCRVGGRPQAN